MIDREGTEHQVLLNKPKPDDFESSDQIVVIGKAAENNQFAAKEILLKCPSKYNNGKPEEKNN
jgi:cytochrome c-type biogenesis protein CcmE